MELLSVGILRSALKIGDNAAQVPSHAAVFGFGYDPALLLPSSGGILEFAEVGGFLLRAEL